MAKQTVPPLPLPKGWPTRVCPASRGQLLRAIQRGPYLILAGVFPLEAFAASLTAQPMVEMPQNSTCAFGGPLHLSAVGTRRCLPAATAIQKTLKTAGVSAPGWILCARTRGPGRTQGISTWMSSPSTRTA